MRRLSLTQIKWLKVVIHLAAFLPFIWLILSINQGWFSADPSKDIQHFTGRMTLKLLLATLLITPVARYGKQPLLIRVRRLVGLWCFAWGTLHLLSYSFLELGINNLALLGSELISRPYLTLGIISWIILLALTCTSTLWSQRKLGSEMADIAQFNLCCRNFGANSLHVVSKNYLAATHHLRGNCSDLVSITLQKIPPMAALTGLTFLCSTPHNPTV
ncbi:methionine sulfoxide reductase heme-binding subunit [Ewingella americana]